MGRRKDSKAVVQQIVLFMSVVICLYHCLSVSVSVSVFSMAVHPDRVTIATGQVAGHDRQEGKVCSKLLLMLLLLLLLLLMLLLVYVQSAWTASLTG